MKTFVILIFFAFLMLNNFLTNNKSINKMSERVSENSFKCIKCLLGSVGRAVVYETPGLVV